MSAQITPIDRMIAKGYDVTEARELLRQMESILDEWHIRRKIILDAATHG